MSDTAFDRYYDQWNRAQRRRRRAVAVVRGGDLFDGGSMTGVLLNFFADLLMRVFIASAMAVGRYLAVAFARLVWDNGARWVRSYLRWTTRNHREIAKIARAACVKLGRQYLHARFVAVLEEANRLLRERWRSEFGSDMPVSRRRAS